MSVWEEHTVRKCVKKWSVKLFPPCSHEFEDVEAAFIPKTSPYHVYWHELRQDVKVSKCSFVF